MQPANASSLSQLLENVAETLDISDNLYEDAVVRYEDVADWLSEHDSPLAVYAPRVYPQGSFRLGTVVRPITEDDHCDIDLVCQLDIAKESTTQADLKTLVVAGRRWIIPTLIGLLVALCGIVAYEYAAQEARLQLAERSVKEMLQTEEKTLMKLHEA